MTSILIASRKFVLYVAQLGTKKCLAIDETTDLFFRIVEWYNGDNLSSFKSQFINVFADVRMSRDNLKEV